MSDYDGQSRCEPHGVTRCVACTAAKRPKKLVVPPAPPEITGAPPPDIEGMDAPSLRAEIDAYANLPGGASQSDIPDIEELGNPAVRATLGLDLTAKDAFDTLPVDDSHASKVMRAAAEYASASRDWAQNVAKVEKIKAELVKAEAALSGATSRQQGAELELKTLVSG
jgi:hypothetical protein